MPRALPGIEFGGRVIGTEQAWALEELPARLAVVGAGASGAEIASAYARLGTETHLFEVLDRVLPTEDADISRLVARGLKSQGIELHTETPIENVQSSEASVTLRLRRRARSTSTGSCSPPGVDPTSPVSASTRRRSRSTDRGLIAVDGAQRTSREGVYAIGDLVAGPALAHKASDEGDHRRRGGGRPPDASARRTSTSRARRSARRTSRASA